MVVMLCPLSGYAETVERIVWGEVLNVEPIVEHHQIAPQPDCRTERPVTDDLRELLAWDLRRECVRRTHSTVNAYRVEYRWDGRTYSKLMSTSPGKRIPLLVRFD